jgi:hypothetical protein
LWLFYPNLSLPRSGAKLDGLLNANDYYFLFETTEEFNLPGAIFEELSLLIFLKNISVNTFKN